MSKVCVVIASIEKVIALLDDLIDIVVDVKIVKINRLMFAEKLIFLLLVELLLQHYAVTHVADVVVVRCERMQAEAADGHFEVGIVRIFSSEDR